MSYSMRDVWQIDDLGDYVAPNEFGLAGTVFPQEAADGQGRRRRWYVARDGVGEWPTPCTCVQQANDLIAALPAVPDDDPRWTAGPQTGVRRL